MLNNKSVFLLSIYSFIGAVISSFVFSSLFGKWYDYIFKPIPFCGLSGLGCSSFLGVIQNSIFAYLFFLPLYIMLVIPKKQWLAWLILIFIPFTMVLIGGSKHLFWFAIFTIAGGIIGWLINMAIKKFKK